MMIYGVIGSGNLASQLVKALTRVGHPPGFILSRNVSTGRRLSRQSGAPLVDILPKPGRSIPLLLICTNDDSIQELFKKHSHSGYILVHFSGGLPLFQTGSRCPGSGVLWPIQTLSSEQRINWNNIPLCLDASNDRSRRKLRELAHILGGPVIEVDSRKRAKIHLAAVFANNFVNAQFTMAKQLLDEEKLEFDILKPLITQTAQAILKTSPEKVQTGPARRGDREVINKHLLMLEKNQDIRAAYEAITDFLLKKYRS
jgi:predicted short-subunit dehydrogenase-like oxidoreductase (DUF2520 family)